MDEEQINIKKIITTVDDEKSYSIDVDETTTFYEFKKILAGAAHLLKNCFRIYHEQQEYTNDYDDNTIQEMFPDLDPVPLKIYSNKDVYEFEDELISVRFNINVPCQMHIGKYKMLYCFTCKKSICSDCFAQDHRNHKVEEKADYLAPAQLLMNNIFSNSSLYKADSRVSKYMDCITFGSNLKFNIFDNLRELINDLEIKFASCLEFFSTSEDQTEKNTNENLELLKKYCIECFIKIKNDINTKGIIIDDEIFLTLYYKLKEIERFKNEYFEENKLKYEKLNTLLAPFVKQVEKISDELKLTFDNYLNKDFYEVFKSSIQENMVEKIEKEQVNDLMFKNLGVPRKSLNRMSLGAITSYKKTGRNTYISPDKLLINQQKEKNPFQKALYSPQQQGLVSESLLGYNTSSSNQKNTKTSYSSYKYSKNEDQKLTGTGLSMIPEKNDINIIEDEGRGFENKKVVTTTTTTNVNNMNVNNITGIGGNSGVSQKRIEEKINTNIVTNLNNMTGTGSGIKSILSNNTSANNLNMHAESNINNVNTVSSISNVSNVSGINNFGVSGNTQNIKKETTIYRTTETAIPTQKTIFTKKEYTVHNTGGNAPIINDIQNQKNITKFTQKEYTINNAPPIPNINDTKTQQNITKTETTTTTITTNNLIGQNRGINTNINTNVNSNANISALNSMNTMNTMNTNINSNINKNYTQGYEVTKYITTTTNQHNIQNSGTQQVSSSSNLLTDEKLVDVLNKEISKNELEYQNKIKNQNIITETYNENIYGKDGTIIQRVTKTQKTEYGISPSMFLFMYPIFKTNKIVGAIEDECTGKVEVNFKQAFGDKDSIQLNEFPQGGAFCNYDKSLYFTGGQETQKGVGKIFLRVSISKADLSAKLVKLPSMIYSHWNHSMISNGNYIFVIGGYNSNKCEYFNLKTLKWEALPDLNSDERQRAMLVIYNDYLYAFMGYTQFSILDSIERININKLSTSKWEKVSISNPENINLKFFGAGIYNLQAKLYFVGGKVGQGNDESDYKVEIYSFDFDTMKFSSTDVYFSGQLNFIESKFHYCNSETIGNFIELNDGCLATIAVSSLLK